MRAQRAVVTGDDHAAAARWVFAVDEVFCREAGGLTGFTQGVRRLGGADAANVEDAGGGQHVLGAPSGVLRRAAGDELGVFGGELVVEAHVLFFGEDGVVGLEVVLLEHGFISTGGATSSQ